MDIFHQEIQIRLEEFHRAWDIHFENRGRENIDYCRLHGLKKVFIEKNLKFDHKVWTLCIESKFFAALFIQILLDVVIKYFFFR